MRCVSSWLRLACILCLAGAALNHAADVWRGGWLPYGYAPLWLNAFWTSLTILDPLAATLLWRRSPGGVWLLLGIMLTDVTVNLRFSLHLGSTLEDSAALLAQILFLGFVLGAASTLLRDRT